MQHMMLSWKKDIFTPLRSQALKNSFYEKKTLIDFVPLVTSQLFENVIELTHYTFHAQC